MSAAALTSNNDKTFYHLSFTPLQNVQNTSFGLATGMESIISSDDSSLDPGGVAQPYLEIIIQPCDKFRFRYKSESGSHGKLRGSEKNRSKTNFPTIKVHNLNKPHDKIEIRASLYTENKMPHIVELVGKNCKNGVCSEKLSKDSTAMFRFLEIENKRKEEAIEILMKKKGSNRSNKEEMRKNAAEDMKQLNMNCAMLCFEVLYDNVPICEKVFSGLIKNLKSTSSDLKITRISSSSGSCSGGDDIILLCDKINKDDIEIHFYEKDENDEILWKGNGIFSPKVDVHHQVAIAFKTPPFKNNAGGMVQMELYRQSDKQSSEPRTYTYIPDDIDYLRHSKKRKFNPVEYVVSPDLNQASSSSGFMSSSDFASSPSNIDVGACADFLGSSDASSTEEDIGQFLIDDWSNPELIEQMLSTLVDSDNFVQRLEEHPPASSHEHHSSMQIDAAAFDFNPYEMHTATLCSAEGYDNTVDFDPIVTQELAYTPQSTAASDRTRRPFIDNGTITQTSSGGGGIFAFLEYLAGVSPSNLWNTTAGRVASYMTPSPLNNIRDTKAHIKEYPVTKDSQSEDKDKIFAQSGLTFGLRENPALKASQSKDKDKIFAQSALTSDMKDLSIQEDNEKDLKPFVSLPVNKMKSPVNVFNRTVFTDANSYDGKCTRNVEGLNKASEINKNFDSFKEGVNEVMKKREKDVYLQYISRLISVKDENGNLFIHLAVLEQSENLNLMARILKIAPHIVNEQNRLKETPLNLAVQKNAWKMAFLLLSEGGNPSIVDTNGNNCFHIAAKSNYTKSMKILLVPSLKLGKRIPSIDCFNYDGFAPLHLSVMNNAKECMQLLLKAGANVNISDRISGSSPLLLAIKQHSSLASDLLSHPDIDLSNEDFKGHSIVHALCAMKGTPMPAIEEFTDLVDWARKTLALPPKDSDESSCSDSSSNSDSNEEAANHQHETGTTPSFNYSRNIHSHIMNEELNSLSEECERRLCMHLDADGGWKKLGLFIGLDERNINGVSKLGKYSSPSKLVMKLVKKLYKKFDKQTLIHILNAADLKNAAEYVRDAKF